MPTLKAAAAAILVLAGTTSAGTARAVDLGPSIARLLTLQYHDTSKDCGSPSRPAYMCTGVMLRATNPSTAFAFYSVSPASQAGGGISISYLRKDAKFESLYAKRNSGFIFDNAAFDEGAGFEPLKVLCAYPIDGASLRRTHSGCGDYELTPAVERFCDQMGVTTAEQWFALYRSEQTYPQGAQCAFDMRPSNPARAEDFYQSLKAQSLLVGNTTFNGSDSQENELVVAPWKVAPAYSPPVIASFYTDRAGLAGARLSQIQWYQATGAVLPAIRLTMPSRSDDDATFVYEASEQAIYPTWEPDVCSRFIASTRWSTRYDPGFRKEIQSLEIVPTECGRRTSAGRTNNFLNELVARHYLDPEWINNADNSRDSIASMRRQLVCVFNIARTKSSWYLEPGRPNTTHEKSMAAGCNNVTP